MYSPLRQLSPVLVVVFTQKILNISQYTFFSFKKQVAACHLQRRQHLLNQFDACRVQSAKCQRPWITHLRVIGTSAQNFILRHKTNFARKGERCSSMISVACVCVVCIVFQRTLPVLFQVATNIDSCGQ